MMARISTSLFCSYATQPEPLRKFSSRKSLLLTSQTGDLSFRYPSKIMSEGNPLPKFGEWDVNDPSSAQDFSIIFNKARTEKKGGGQNDYVSQPESSLPKHASTIRKPPPKKWFCCG